MDLTPFINNLRESIERGLKSDEFDYNSYLLSRLDDFIHSDVNSNLEKAFYLILNQFPGDHKDYTVHPREMVLVSDVYDLSVPGIEYEIDFALYGGSIDNPVKIAIECDGIRSHAHKHSRKDRRKDINLQAAGWMVMRFTSKEIHHELFKYADDENYTSGFLFSIENVISERLKLVTGNSYVRYRSQLTGYKWGDINCTVCGTRQAAILNKKNHKCRTCYEKFTRIIDPSEQILYEHNGLLIFKE